MADPRFFKREGPFTVSQLVAMIGCEFDGDGDLSIEDVSSLDQAGSMHVSFLDNVKYKDQFAVTKAGACIVHRDLASLAPKGLVCLISDQPYKSYALAAQAFYPLTKFISLIDEAAIIDGSAQIAEGCCIEAGAVIKSGVKIGQNSRIASGAVIGVNVEIGENCNIEENCVISHSLIGNHVRVYPGGKIGQDGFGFAINHDGFIKVPQLGRVIIEDGVQIGANTTIDRGAGPDTVIGAGTWIDNLVQIGHNVKIGKGCVIVAQVGISGSTVLEDYVMLGGQAGLAGHLHIGTGARIGAQSGVMKDIAAGEEHLGSPSQPIRKHMRQVALLNRLIQNKKS